MKAIVYTRKQFMERKTAQRRRLQWRGHLDNNDLKSHFDADIVTVYIM